MRPSVIAAYLRRWARGRPPRVLLAWEYGGGHTHTANLVGVARHLRGAGIDGLAALHDTRASRRFTALGIPTVQNTVWPQARRFASHDRERPYGSFLDRLGNLGFAEADAVAAMLAHYDGLFALFEPDIVLAENAYGAHLAARGRKPVVAFGFGQFLPPVVEGRLALPDAATASWSEAEILVGLNDGLARAGRTPLAGLAEMFDVEATLPFGPAAFDLHTPLRRQTALPAHVEGFAPGLRAGIGGEVFVYLEGFGAGATQALAALPRFGRPVRAHLPGLARAERADLLAAGVLIEDEPLPAAEIIVRSACVLHHGGVGLAALCLSAGLPQVILSRQLDNRTAGDFVAREGLGAHRRLAEATTEGIVEAVRACEALQTRCLARAPAFDAWFGDDPTRQVAAEACRLIGLPPPAA